MFHFHLNDRTVSVAGDPSRPLIHVLRDDFGLTGAKLGCGIGQCGACTVLVNGRPTLSCRTRLSAVLGRHVQTIEGLSAEGLTAVGQALLETGAVQCGFCTPGVVMSLTVLLERNPLPDRAAIISALDPHLCRCTGYWQMVEAVENVVQGKIWHNGNGGLGESPLKTDGEVMVTGSLRFAADMSVSNMLYGAVLWAKYPHALIKRIDTVAAEAVSGVVAVFTAEDVPGQNRYGKAVKDQPVLCDDRVRFMGDKVALVVAESEEVAWQAVKLVEVEYEPLPIVTDPEGALSEGSPLIFESGNLAAERRIARGDVEKAFTEAHHLHEAVFRTPFLEHAPLEPEAALAIFDEEGKLTVIAPTQNVFFDRAELCRILNLKRHDVRVIQAPTGGAFGKREDMVVQPLAALAAFKLKRPVRIVLSREESFRSTTKRHPMIVHRKMAADKEGRITALQVDVIADTGAYTSWAPNILRKACVHATGPYEIPNIRVIGKSVYTNNAYSGAFRGFGSTQVLYAAERHMDMAARAWGFDPVQLRRINLLKDGGQTATQRLRIDQKVTLNRCLDAVMSAMGSRLESVPESQKIRHGRGCSTIFYGIGYGGGIPDVSGARVVLKADGRFELRVGAVDYGQGSSTIFRQIAAQALGTDFDNVDLIAADSEWTPDSGSTVASRQTLVTGRAVQEVCEKFRRSLVESCAELGLKYVPQDLDALRRLYEQMKADDRSLEAFHRHSVKTEKLDEETGQGIAYATYAWGAQAAEVEVNIETGKVKVLKLAAAHDVGKIINLEALRGQVFGAVAMGIGMALSEEYKVVKGVPQTLNFDTYRILRASDMPEITVEFIESPDSLGPYGARGIGEPALVGTAPAVVNAICDALGIETTDLPITTEVIKRACLGRGR